MVKYYFFISLFLTSTGFAKKTAPFETFKSLKGKWDISVGNKTAPFQMTYQEGSRGSIMTEQFGKELSVFSKDKNSLLMTHFCNSGHQSRLKLKRSNSSNHFEFVAFDLINKESKKAPHVQKIIYDFKSKKEFKLSIIWKTGKKERVEEYKISKAN